MHISLTDTLDTYVREKVASGLYNNASEVIREALRLKIEADESKAAKFARLKEAIDLGLDELDRGEVVPFDLGEINEELDRELSVSA